MAYTLLDLSKDLDKLIKTRNRDVENLSKSLSNDILKDLIYETPVDTSAALSNWRVSLNTKISDSIDPYKFGVFGSTRNISARQALSVGKSLIDRRTLNDVLYISNTIDYIVDLNYGTSRQAAPGYVETLLHKNVNRYSKLYNVKIVLNYG